MTDEKIAKASAELDALIVDVHLDGELKSLQVVNDLIKASTTFDDFKHRFTKYLATKLVLSIKSLANSAISTLKKED